jgi:hypothetical protein
MAGCRLTLEAGNISWLNVCFKPVLYRRYISYRRDMIYQTINFCRQYRPA